MDVLNRQGEGYNNSKSDAQAPATLVDARGIARLLDSQQPDHTHGIEQRFCVTYATGVS